MAPAIPVWLLAALLVDRVHGLNNGLAKTPSMGWNNWNSFGCSVSEDLVVGTAERIPQLGLRDVGYKYVILDDCWASKQRASDRQLVADPSKFPNGMKHVSDRVHAQNLKYGMYSTAGTQTCAGYPASLGYETIDAKTFASWQIDYLKYDNCYNNGQSGTQQKSLERYKKMSDALNATGRPILYSMCNWGEDQPWKWAAQIANSWRMSGDITDTFDKEDKGCPCKAEQGESCFGGYACSVTNILNKVAAYAEKGAPGGWNDLDMLEVGNGRMSDTEYVTHFTMWSVVKSILIMGHDVRKTNAKALSILLNPAIIAVNQDPAGIPAVRKWVRGSLQMWAGSLSGGDYVVTLLNLGGSQQSMSATASEIFGSSGGAGKAWDVYDLWGNRMSDAQANAIINNPTRFGGGTDLSAVYYNATARPYSVGLAANDAILMGKKTGSLAAGGTLSATVASHGVAAFRLRPAGAAGVTGSPSTSSAAGPTSSAPAPSSTAPSSGTVAKYGQCGGINYSGPTECEAGSTCKFSNDWYSQCL